MSLDRIDLAILTILQADGSLSVSEVASRIGMTPPPCWRRIRRLRDAGYLERQVWLVDPEKVGLSVTIYATIKLGAHDRDATSAFRERIAALDEVQECYVLLGGIDVLVKLRVPNIKAYETFFYERLSQLPGVREVESSVVLSEVKSTTALPLGAGIAG
ncbi:Lrp/AsnC family transcriptional regulator [Novosphingobium sp. Gsoil 351]|uniref:Lrp/AsnC family transcriptional regulator n=1 Tax=Novosphingobium sp. Gsoil 351 TaxID=2675225 RepID=UPI0012B466A6|nr:Lrp/AsnC family transcriptional regulator [Novosphingobium sp. Gsoil 351]QGN55639.1 winged helix-turn-helix transcriptional regulator [Novosphingobium sp. Gsoil 351]